MSQKRFPGLPCRSVFITGLVLWTTVFALAGAASGQTLSISFSEADHFTLAENATAHLSLSSTGSDYVVALFVTDWNNAETQRQQWTGVSGNWSQEISVSLPRYGPYNITVELRQTAGGSLLAQAATRMVRIVTVPVLTDQQRRDSYIGINTHDGAHWNTFAKVGIHWARDYSWKWLADNTSRYAHLRNTLNSAQQAGVNILPCYATVFWNENHTAYLADDNYIKDTFEMHARAFPEFEYWEIDNESDWHFVDSNGVSKEKYLQDYRRYIAAASEGIARAGNAKVVLNGTAGVEIAMAEQLLDPESGTPVVADLFDVVNYHDYFNTTAPEYANTDSGDGGVAGIEKAFEVHKRMNRLAHENGKEAWLTEIGYGEKYDRSVGLYNQTLYVPRTFLLSRAVGTDKMFWFWDRDGAADLWINAMGLVDIDGNLRPFGAALAALSKLTATSEVLCWGHLSANAWYVLFLHPDGSQLMAAWTGTGSLSWNGNPPTAAYDLFGNSLSTTDIVFTPEVTYLAFPAQQETPLWVDAGSGTVLYSPIYGTFVNGAAGKNGHALPPNSTVTWSKVSGTGTVTFHNPNSPSTFVTFPAYGSYKLRLTVSDGETTEWDEVSFGVKKGNAHLVYTATPLGNGLYKYIFRTEQESIPNWSVISYRITAAFEGIDGAKIHQVRFYDAMNINTETLANQFDGLGVPPYSKALDSWACSPIFVNDIPGMDPRNGNFFNGFLVEENAFVINGYSNDYKNLYIGMPVAHIVANGNIRWCGMIRVNEAYSSDVTNTFEGQTGVETIPGDFNVDGIVDLSDYTVWADHYGQSGYQISGDGNRDGLVDLADYTIWADNYGMTAP